MAHVVRIINGKAPSGGSGGVSDADLSNLAVNFFTPGVVKVDDYKVQQKGTPDMSVDVLTGKAYVANPSSTMLYNTYLDATPNVSIGANNAGNPRIDALVIRVDLGATPNSSAGNVASLVVVQGTPAASPSAPSDSAIQTAVGAGNPFLRLANITVANGASSITDANIASARVGAGMVLEGAVTQKGLSSSPSTPSTGYVRLYFKSDKKLYKKDDTGSESEVGLSAVGATVRRSSSFSVPNSAWTDVQWNDEDFDTSSFHDNATNPDRVTIPSGQGGKYLVTFSLQFTSNTTGFRSAKIQVNGADGAFPAMRGIGNISGDAIVLSGSGVITLAQGDIVRLQAFQNSGGALNVNTDNSLLSVVKLG